MVCLHGHTGDGACIYLCTGTNTRYQVYGRHFGCRTYRGVGKPTKSKRAAYRRMADVFNEQGFKRVIVCVLADYYDPEPIAELIRK